MAPMPGSPARAVPTRAVVSWVLYDLANTIFSMGVVSLYFSKYVRDQVGVTRADTVYGLIVAISMGIIFVVSPLLGSMTDRAARRMPFLIWSTVLCCAGTALMARGPFMAAALLFIFTNAAYQAGLQFYDALLPEVSTEANRGRISGIGIGVGYLGSYIAVGLGLTFGTNDLPRLFTLIAAGFFLFALPCFLFVSERGNPRPRPILGWQAIRDATSETITTLRSGHEYPGLLRFLVGRVFYTDAINTVIQYMFLFTINVAIGSGLDQAVGEQAGQVMMLVAISFAVIGGIVWGRVVDAIGPKRTLTIVLWLWIVTFGLAATIGFLALPPGTLYAVGSLAGVAMGGAWAADRPFMLRLAPPERVGEFYGLYGMVGRFSAITGPILWSAIYWLAVVRGGAAPLTGQAIALLSLLGLVIVSYVILRPVSDRRRPVAEPVA
jgi:UMF1 family MFS transporter